MSIIPPKQKHQLSLVSEPFQWNPPSLVKAGLRQKVPCDFFDEGFQGHPKVRFTSYNEVNELLGTSGCSRKDPYWSWSVMGVLETERGKTIVNPGDWILEILPGYFIAVSQEQFDFAFNIF